MSRIVDEPYFTYSAYNALTSGIQVKCPIYFGKKAQKKQEEQQARLKLLSKPFLC